MRHAERDRYERLVNLVGPALNRRNVIVNSVIMNAMIRDGDDTLPSDEAVLVQLVQCLAAHGEAMQKTLVDVAMRSPVPLVFKKEGLYVEPCSTSGCENEVYENTGSCLPCTTRRERRAKGQA